MRTLPAPEKITAEEVERRSRRALEVPLLRFLGASLVDPVDGCWSLSLQQSPNVLNAVDVVHGGVIATLLDLAAYLAVVPHLSIGEEAVTVAFAASYVAGARSGEELRAKGCLIRRTRHLAFVSAELRSESGTLALANVTKTMRSSS